MLDNEKYYELLDEVKHLKETGSSQNNVLQILKLKEVSVMDAIKIISDLYTDSLVKAKEIVYESDTWRETAIRYEEFHQQLFDNIEQLEDK